MLNINWNLIWTIVNIVVLYLLLRHFLFKPVTAIMEQRKKVIEDSFAEAEKKKTEADSLKNQYEASLKDANERTYQMVNSAKVRAKSEYDQIVEQAHRDASKIIVDAGQEAEAQRERILKEVQNEIADVAISAAIKMIGNSVDNESNKKRLEDFLNEAGVSE